MSEAREAPALPARPAKPASDAAIRVGLAVGPILACVGIAWTAMAPSTFSSAAVLAGLLACFYATHRFGRLGADEGSAEGEAEGQGASREAREASAATAGEAERLRKEREAARAREKQRRT